MTENTTPLSGKIDSAAALKAVLKELNKKHMPNAIPRWIYKQYKRNTGTITDDTFHAWRDDLRECTGYWTWIHLPGTATPAEQDATLHLAKHGDQAFVAFAETEDKRKRDIFTRMRYGKYLTKFHPEIENEDVKKLVAEFEYKHGAAPELRISDKAEDFVHAIKGGPSDSCQADRFYGSGRFDFAGHAHPAICYASGDIQVAWIEDTNGTVKARALINKAKKRHSRPYGDTEKIDRLLSDAGYEKRSGALIGCRLEVIENQNGGGWLMPYVDAGTSSGGGSLYAERDDTYWVLNDNGDGVSTSCGYEHNGVTSTDEDEEQEPEYGHCDSCGEGLHNSDDYMYSEYHDATYCTHCADRHWYYAIVRARNTFDYVSQGDCTYIDCLSEHVLDEIIDELDVVQDSHTDEWIKFDDAVQCVYDGEWHHVDDCVAAGEDSNGTIWLHKEDMKDKNCAEKIYYDESGDPFWFESDEIQEWVEAGEDLDRYALKADKESGQEALPLGTCPEETTKPSTTCPGGTWQEIYRWMQDRGIRFEFGDGTWWVPEGGLLNFDALAEPPHYRVKPDQPDAPAWRDTLLEAQRCGVKFEVRSDGTNLWSNGAMHFNGEKMSSYRIQNEEVIEERIAA